MSPTLGDCFVFVMAAHENMPAWVVLRLGLPPLPV